MKNIEKFENLVADIEKHIPTIEYIKEQTGINVVSLRKYFPRAYHAKRVIISGVYIIFTESREKYVGSSKDVLNQIDIRNRDIHNILVVYIYETDHTDTSRMESWFKYELRLGSIIPKKIEDSIPKDTNIEDIIPKNIGIIRCTDYIPIEYIPHVPGAYILQFVDKECYVGSSDDLRKRLKTHKNHLSSFIDTISICETQDALDALVLEHIFIKILKPKYNRLLYRKKIDNPDDDVKMSINTPTHKGANTIKRKHKMGKSMQLTISKNVSELLDKKIEELHGQGIFSLSIQTLTELAIKEGLNIICDNISQISEMEDIRKYVDDQIYW